MPSASASRVEETFSASRNKVVTRSKVGNAQLQRSTCTERGHQQRRGSDQVEREPQVRSQLGSGTTSAPRMQATRQAAAAPGSGGWRRARTGGAFIGRPPRDPVPPEDDGRGTVQLLRHLLAEVVLDEAPAATSRTTGMPSARLRMAWASSSRPLATRYGASHSSGPAERDRHVRRVHHHHRSGLHPRARPERSSCRCTARRCARWRGSSSCSRCSRRISSGSCGAIGRRRRADQIQRPQRHGERQRPDPEVVAWGPRRTSPTPGAPPRGGGARRGAASRPPRRAREQQRRHERASTQLPSIRQLTMRRRPASGSMRASCGTSTAVDGAHPVAARPATAAASTAPPSAGRAGAGEEEQRLVERGRCGLAVEQQGCGPGPSSTVNPASPAAAPALPPARTRLPERSRLRGPVPVHAPVGAAGEWAPRSGRRSWAEHRPPAAAVGRESTPAIGRRPRRARARAPCPTEDADRRAQLAGRKPRGGAQRESDRRVRRPAQGDDRRGDGQARRQRGAHEPRQASAPAPEATLPGGRRR